MTGGRADKEAGTTSRADALVGPPLARGQENR